MALNQGKHPEYAQMSDKDIMVAAGTKIAGKTPRDLNSELTRASRKAYSDNIYNRNIVHKAVKADLFCCNNVFYVFESTNLMLWRLNADYKILDSFIVGMNPEAKEIRMIQDPVTKLLFLAYRINGTCYVSQIDPSTGLIAKTKPITGFPFAEKVRVYDSRIYLIYQMATGQTFTNLFSISL